MKKGFVSGVPKSPDAKGIIDKIKGFGGKFSYITRGDLSESIQYDQKIPIEQAEVVGRYITYAMYTRRSAV